MPKQELEEKELQKSPEIQTTFNGRLEAFSEQGMEGLTMWAFMDEKFITHIKPEFGVHGTVWDATNPERKGEARYAGKVLRNNKWVDTTDGIYQGELTKPIIEWEDGKIEERLSDTLLVENWSYDGLHFLNNGDRLTIYDKEEPEKVLWEGIVDLTKAKQSGEQEKPTNVDYRLWTTWFALNYPVHVELGKESIKTIKLNQERAKARQAAQQ